MVDELINTNRKFDFNYLSKIFWLFMFGNLIGVLVEGVWYKLMYHHWETHVVTIWGPFCLIYGIGVVILYISGKMLKDKNKLTKFLTIALFMDLVELLGGMLLEYGLGMRAWDYSNEFLNLRGHICLKMTIVWGIVGLIFAYFIPFLDKVWSKVVKFSSEKIGKGVTLIAIIFMTVNILFTSVCLVRWSHRYDGIDSTNKLMSFIDKKYNDQFMQTRFIEWYFIK